jgi:hypothetical protein
VEITTQEAHIIKFLPSKGITLIQLAENCSSKKWSKITMQSLIISSGKNPVIHE